MPFDGMSGVGVGIGVAGQIERLWYFLFIPSSGSLSVFAEDLLNKQNKLQLTIVNFGHG